jgi:uncharacterized protein YbjT (DUF2867 family)
MSERVLVIGATQGTGLIIAQRLQQEGYQVRALARDTTKGARQLGAAIEVVQGDVTRPATLGPAIAEVQHIILTAGVTKRPAGEQLIKAVEFTGTANILTAAQQQGFAGRLLYMTSVGVNRSSSAGWLLNLLKGNTLHWRKAAEAALRDSGLNYTIIRAGVLNNAPTGQKAIEVGQEDQPLRFSRSISRADVANVFVRVLTHAAAQRTTFEVVWGRGSSTPDWQQALNRLAPDTAPVDRTMATSG